MSLRELPRGVGGEPDGVRRRAFTRRSRRCTRSTRPARPRTRCTATSREGKVGVLCLAPEGGLGVTDDETRAQHLDQITLFPGVTRAMTPHVADRDRPRRHRRHATSKPRSTTTDPRSAVRSSTARSSRRDGVEEALLKVADSYIQLLTPSRPDSTGARSTSRQGRGPPSRRLPRRRLRRGARGGEGQRSSRDRRAARARGAGGPRSRSCTRRPRSGR